MDNHINPRKGFFHVLLIGLIGAIIGGLIVGGSLIYYLDINFTGDINNSNTDTNNNTVTELQSTTSSDSPTTVEAVAKLVTPAVVGVQTVGVTQDAFMRQYESTGVGSGVIITEDGYILTNHHVVTDNPKSLTVSLKDGRTLPADKIWSNEDLDLAVIKIDASGLTPATLGDSENIAVGQTAIAIGNPLGLTFERTVTAGIISAINRSILIDTNSIAEDLIQTDASINQGNSGGPLLNSKGEVIGINTYKINAEGMGFAIPINIAKPIINQIIDNGEFRPTVMGISCLDKEIASYLADESITLNEGILIIEVQSGSGADKAGLKKDDIITTVDNVQVNTMLKLREILYRKLPGDTVEVIYTRNGKESSATVSLMKQE
ncbi:MAG: S1C family serine protease [Eubacteriales bacterium]